MHKYMHIHVPVSPSPTFLGSPSPLICIVNVSYLCVVSVSMLHRSCDENYLFFFGSFFSQIYQHVQIHLFLLNRLFRKLLQPSHQDRLLQPRILLYLEQPSTLSLKFRAMPRCYLVEFYRSI